MFWMWYIASEIRWTTRKVIVLLPGMMSDKCSYTSIPTLKCLAGDHCFLGFFVLDDCTSSPSVLPAPAITTPPRVCAFMPTPYMPTPHMPTNKISVRLCLHKQSERYYDRLSEITDDKFNTGYRKQYLRMMILLLHSIDPNTAPTVLTAGFCGGMAHPRPPEVQLFIPTLMVARCSFRKSMPKIASV